MEEKFKLRQVLQVPVIVAALGYFVDIYDLLLFGIVRISSLQSLGLKGDELKEVGVYLQDVQMVGLLVGGILWGIMGDKRGRLSVLFGSILIYSLANILNGMVTTVNQYAILRFIAGVGLAGELGAGITLVSETLSKELRGYGTTLIASVGVLGAVLANVIAKEFDWRIAYYIGGGLGLALLLLRVSVFESGIFLKIKESHVSRGDFLQLFSQRSAFFKYMQCILVGLPIWFVIGKLIFLSPEIGKSLGIVEMIDPGIAIMYAYMGLSLGDLTSGVLSQMLKSRKKVLFIYISLTLIMILFYIFFPNTSAKFLYFQCGALGFSIGYWALFVTIAAEQFGTNIRATVATTVPNFVRGSLVPISWLFAQFEHMFKESHGTNNIIYASLIVGLLTIVIAFISAVLLKETYGKDLNYIEGK